MTPEQMSAKCRATAAARRAYLDDRSVREWFARLDRAERLATRKRAVRTWRSLFRGRGDS